VLQSQFEEVCSRYALHFPVLLAEVYRPGTGQKGPEYIALSGFVASEKVERVVVTGCQYTLDVGIWIFCVHCCTGSDLRFI
jgi:hypothetical protein